MVGVAGGSRGCTICKKRRVKCDETFPKCLRCLKSNRDCGGPIIGPVFRKQHFGVQGKTFVSSVASESSPAAHRNPDGGRWRRKARMTDDETRIYDDSRQFKHARALPSVVIEHSIQKQLRAFNSNSIPRELTLFPDYDLYNYCVNIFFDRFSVAGNWHQFSECGEYGNASTLTEMIPQFVLSPVPSATTFAARALVISHCSSMFQDPDIALLASNWYVQALRYQKELVTFIMSDSESSFWLNDNLSDSATRTLVPVEEVSSSLSSKSASCSDSTRTSSSNDLIQWARSDTQPVPKPNKFTFLLPENSSIPLGPPVDTAERHVSSMRGNVMSYEDDAIVAGMLLTIYEVLNCSDNSSWSRLLSGANELMRLRGSQAYRTGFNGTLFQSVRSMLAIHALGGRKKTFFNDRDWKTVPWEFSAKSIHHYLLDLILEVPEYEEIVERALMYVFDINEDDPDDDIGDPTTRTPRLRKKYRTRAVWAELRETHKKLTDVEARFDKWFQEYSQGARDYARRHLHLSPTVSFDSATATPNVPLPRCPATKSDSEYAATHFFRPLVNYTTLHDAHMVTTYYSARMIIAYLQLLTVCFAYLDFEASIVSKPCISHPGLTDYFESKYGYILGIAGLICRSCNYIIRASSIAALNVLFPLRVAHYSIQDTNERGWIWNELLRMHDMGIRLSLADPTGRGDQFVSEWKKFKALDVCPGCGEHVRPLILGDAGS
ncbi:hypothetical protein V1504DRAFT_465466 [Lipomyces starkeyi]